MDQSLVFEGLQFISSKEAARLTGYAKDYIGQVCREGRVKARRIGRAWFVNLESLKAHKKNKSREKNNDETVVAENVYAQTQTATVKITKNITDNESISPTSGWYASYRHNKIEQPIKYFNDDAPLFPPIGIKATIKNEQSVHLVADKSRIVPTEVNSLISSEDISTIPIPIRINTTPVKKYYVVDQTITASLLETKNSSQPKSVAWYFAPLWLKPATVALALMLVVFSGYQISQISMISLFNQTQDRLISAQTDFTSFARGLTLSKASEIQLAAIKSANLDLIASPQNVASQTIYPIWQSILQSMAGTVYRSLVTVPKLFNNLTHQFNPFAKLARFDKSIDNEVNQQSISTEREGLVVLPTEPGVDSAETIAKVKQTFSDEVEVYPDDSGGSGVIRPVFRDRQSDDFLFVLVPIQESLSE